MDSRTAQTLTPREYHARRAAERHASREALRERRLRQARASIRRWAPRFPAVRSVYLFGSLVQPGRFHDASDIDVAIECDDVEAETPFARALEAELEIAVDLRPFEGAVADAVEQGGEKVYG